jgi:hypothetical protein
MRRDPLPEHFRSLEDAGKFWDTHDSADYEEHFKDVECEVDLKRRVYLVPIESALYRKVRTIARKKGISCETLLNLWVQEKAC